MIEKHNNIASMIERSNKPEMLKYLRMQRLEVSRSSNGCNRNWNMLAMKLCSEAKEEVLNDMRNYFRVRNE